MVYLNHVERVKVNVFKHGNRTKFATLSDKAYTWYAFPIKFDDEEELEQYMKDKTIIDEEFHNE